MFTQLALELETGALVLTATVSVAANRAGRLGASVDYCRLRVKSVTLTQNFWTASI